MSQARVDSHNRIIIMPFRANDLTLRVILYNTQYHSLHCVIVRLVRHQPSDCRRARAHFTSKLYDNNSSGLYNISMQNMCSRY